MNSRALLPIALALVAVASACAPRFDPRLVDVPIAGRPWVTTEQVGHPLVGKIWDTKAGRLVDEAALDAAVTSADFVTLGETHDNPDQHLLQARLVRAITSAGKRPALGFEMLEADQQPVIDAALARTPHDPDAVGSAVRWDKSGWPPFRWYRPIVAAGLEAGLPIVAANPSRATLKEVRKKGKDALDPALRARLERDEPIPPAVLQSLRSEMAASHCGALPAEMVDPLVLVQRVKDATMAGRMAAAGAGRGGVLVTGRGHARDDRGVPAALAKDEPGKRIVAVGFFEVEAGKTDPAAYREDEETAGRVPYDFLVFTPGAKREDMCAGFRAHMQKMEKMRKAAPPAAQPPAQPPAPASAPAKP